MSHSFKKNKLSGFTLVELLVSISILIVTLTVILLNQSSYSEAISLSNLAQDMSLTISRAQTYGLGSKERSPGTADFNSAYGISVTMLEADGVNGYIIFSDRNANDTYDGTWSCGATECVEKVPFSNGNYIADICELRTAGVNQCGTIGKADVSYRRPSSAGRLSLFSRSGLPYNPANVIGFRIVLKSRGGLTRNVSVYNSGQISVQ